jgi:dipeptidyl aminopeptidase/acylaminoacyl peptidase
VRLNVRAVRFLAFSLFLMSSYASLCKPLTTGEHQLGIESNQKRNGGMMQNYERAERFGSSEMGTLVSRSNVDPHWIGTTDRFWYRVDAPGMREFILVDSKKGTHAPAFDQGKLSRNLSKASGVRYSAKQLPFTSITYSEDGQSIFFIIGSQWWKCSLKTYECVKSSSPETQIITDSPASEGTDPSRSHDGKWTVSVRDNNIMVRASDGSEKQLTADGSATNFYEQPSWSPVSDELVFWRTVPGSNLPMYVIESSPKDSLRPILHQYAYALPGDRVDTHELWVCNAENGKLIKANTEIVDWGDVPSIRWQPDGHHFTFEQTWRGYHLQKIIEGDVDNGQCRTIIEENSNTFIYPPFPFIKYLDSSGEIIWASERDGWNHLYLYDIVTGKVKNQITHGDWVVRGVESADEKTRQIVFMASGMTPNEDPYLIKYYRIHFDGYGLTCLTPGNGQHSIVWSPDRKYIIDNYSRADMAPITELRRASDGSLVCELEHADIHLLLKTGWKMPEVFQAKGRDGKTDIYGVIYRPSKFDPSKKYPVIEDIYAGPQGAFVPKTFSAQRADQAMAELGFIVVQIDGMGTGNRSKVFHNVAYKNLGDCGFPDRIAWMKAAAGKYPYMDLSRVGIFGVSAGGYDAAHALIAHPEFYKVAVSIAGNHDSRTDKVWWNELWMGYPVGPEYAEQSNTTHAAEMQGKLFLVHGELDDNVNPSASTMQFVNALIKANKNFDFLLVPGAGHGYGRYVQRRMWDYFVKNLLDKTPPEGFELKAAADNSCTISIRNLLDVPVSIYWVGSPGSYTKYHDLAPGEEIKQNSYIGHNWVALIHGKEVSSYTVSSEAPEWDIAP